MTVYKSLKTDVKDRILTVTLNRPERLNAFNFDMQSEMVEVFSKVNDDDEVRAVIVTGEGRGFCAGADLKEVLASQQAALGEEDFLGKAARVYAQLREFPKPVIAAINGYATGLRFFLRVTLGRGAGFDRVPVLKERRRLPMVLTPEEVARIIAAAPGLKYRTALSVTYGAGGSTRARTHAVVEWVRKETHITPMAHLTCTAHTRAEIGEILTNYTEAGVENILALGGDPALEAHPAVKAFGVSVALAALLRAVTR